MMYVMASFIRKLFLTCAVVTISPGGSQQKAPATKAQGLLL
jgi:hypothetical protein